MHYVYNLGTGVSRNVKNLGWLLRNTHKVAKIELWELPEGRGQFVATLTERSVPVWEFRANFASFQIMQKWVRRPSLSGVIKYTHFRNLKD